MIFTLTGNDLPTLYTARFRKSSPSPIFFFLINGLHREKLFDIGSDSILLTSLQFSFGYNLPAFDASPPLRRNHGDNPVITYG